MLVSLFSILSFCIDWDVIRNCSKKASTLWPSSGTLWLLTSQPNGRLGKLRGSCAKSFPPFYPTDQLRSSRWVTTSAHLWMQRQSYSSGNPGARVTSGRQRLSCSYIHIRRLRRRLRSDFRSSQTTTYVYRITETRLVSPRLQEMVIMLVTAESHLNPAKKKEITSS